VIGSPVSEYYECVRLPLNRQLSSLLLVELTGKKNNFPGYIGSLLFLTILSLHATPGHPGGLKKPHHIIAESVPQV
jgi:hypothetical protein